MKEQHGSGLNKFFTDTEYWDCSCAYNYIHSKKKGNYCPNCDTFEEDGMPDSRVTEIEVNYNSDLDCAVKKEFDMV